MQQCCASRSTKHGLRSSLPCGTTPHSAPHSPTSSAPFPTPPGSGNVSGSRMGRSSVVIEAPSLARTADPSTFAEYLASPINTFKNLGGDTILIAPSPTGSYPHFAAFLRTAPAGQADELFRAIGNAAAWKGAGPPWVSTAGMGVPLAPCPARHQVKVLPARALRVRLTRKLRPPRCRLLARSVYGSPPRHVVPDTAVVVSWRGTLLQHTGGYIACIPASATFGSNTTMTSITTSQCERLHARSFGRGGGGRGPLPGQTKWRAQIR